MNIKKYLLSSIIVSVIIIGQASAKLPDGWETLGITTTPISKDTACNNNYPGSTQPLQIKWEGQIATNNGYTKTNITNEKGEIETILVYVVNVDIPTENKGFSHTNYLFSYNCKTKKTTDNGLMNMVIPVIPLYVKAYSWGISEVMLTQPPIDITKDTSMVNNKPMYYIIRRNKDTKTWATESQISTSLNRGDKKVTQMYYDLIKENLIAYKNSIPTNSPLLQIIDSPSITLDNVGDITNNNYLSEIVFKNNNYYRVLGFSFQIDGTQVEFPKMYARLADNIYSPYQAADLASIETTLGDKEVKRLHEQGLTKYSLLHQFLPENYFTREQAAKFFSQFAINILQKKVDNSLECTFSDLGIADSTLQNDIITSCKLGLFKGSKGKFDPKRQLLAEEAIAVLIRALSGPLEEPSKSATSVGRYENYMNKAEELKLLPVFGVDVNNPITRGVIGNILFKAK